MKALTARVCAMADVTSLVKYPPSPHAGDNKWEESVSSRVVTFCGAVIVQKSVLLNFLTVDRMHIRCQLQLEESRKTWVTVNQWCVHYRANAEDSVQLSM